MRLFQGWIWLLLGMLALSWPMPSFSQTLGAEFRKQESRISDLIAEDNYQEANAAIEQLRGLSDGGKVAEMHVNYWAGRLAHESYDRERSIHLLQIAANLATELGDGHILGDCQWRLAALHSGIWPKQRLVEDFRSAIALLTQERDTAAMCAAWYELGGLLLETGSQAEGKEALAITSSLAAAAGLKRAEATVQSYWGVHYFNIGEFAQALPPTLLSLEAYQELGRHEDVARTQNMVGSCLNRLGQPQKALQYLHQALKTAKEKGYRAVEASTLTNIGVILQEGGQYDEALQRLLDAYEIYRLLNHTVGQSACLNNIAYNYQQQGILDQAIAYQKKGLLIDQANQDQIGEAISLCNLGEYHKELGQTEQAIGFYNQSLAIIKLIGPIGIEADLYKGLSECNKAMGDFKQALHFKEKADSIKLANEPEKKDSALGLVWEYEGQQQAQKISELEDKYQWVSQLALLALLLVLAAISGWIVMIVWKRRLARELEQLDKDLESKDQELGLLQNQVASLGMELVRQKQLLDLVKRENGEDAELSQDAFISKLHAKRHWPTFLAEFEMHNPSWLQHLRNSHPDLSSTDIRLLALAKMGLSTTESADFLSITVAGVKKARQRIRKKLGLESEESIDQFLNTF